MHVFLVLYSQTNKATPFIIPGSMSPRRAVSSGTNKKFVEENARRQLASTSWQSQSDGGNNLNVSVAEEDGKNMSSVSG